MASLGKEELTDVIYEKSEEGIAKVGVGVGLRTRMGPDVPLLSWSHLKCRCTCNCWDTMVMLHLSHQAYFRHVC